MRRIKVKAQSILEYIIVLSAILVAIIAGTIGFSRGVGNGLANMEGMSDRLSNASATEENRRAREANLTFIDRKAHWDATHTVVTNGTTP